MAKNNLNSYYTDEQLIFIAQLRKQGTPWAKVQDEFNSKFNDNKNHDALRMVYSKYADLFELQDDKAQVKQLAEVVSAKKRSSKLAKENKVILEYISTKEDILDRIQALVKTVSSKKITFSHKKPAKGKKPMTIEVMLSDLHYGKKTDTFDVSVARRRMTELGKVVIDEIERNSKLYNVERVIAALLGDIIESATMHGLESARGSEFGNSRQVQEAINSLFFDFFVPVGSYCAKNGIKIDVPAVTGNHDRTESDRTMNDPGEENLTYIIYKTLEMLCDQTGMKHIKFYIPKQPYVALDIYGNCAVYEHFDNAKANTKNALEKLLNDRQTQVKRIVDFLRGGHFHETTIYGRGKIIVNGSLPGSDSYANVKGYESHSDQMINYYVPTKERPTSYYRSFPVYLV